ncbi:MAG: hypothetical protein ABR573_04330 [Candidatus Dormibacteria bacterium]
MPALATMIAAEPAVLLLKTFAAMSILRVQPPVNGVTIGLL